MAAGESPGLFEPGRNCCVVARARRVALLIDGAAYFGAFAAAAEQARHSIDILAWDFSSTARLHFERRRWHRRPAELGPFLNWLARRRPGLAIRILDWDYPMLFGTDREFPPVWGLGWTPHRRVEVAYDDSHPAGGSHHQKIVAIDGAMAFVGGFDLTDRRWDTPEHLPDDPRRSFGRSRYPPFHDLMMAVDGPAAAALADIVRARWLGATGETLPPPPAGADPWPADLAVDLRDVDVALSRTLPPLGGQAAVREIEALYLDMIGAARRRIYIENQYFTAAGIAAALAERLAEPDGPEVVLVLRLLSHGWLEEHTMHVLRTRLIRDLRAADRHGRCGIFYADRQGLASGSCIDVHAKLMIVDEELLRIGSANLSNRSLGMDSECDATIEARADPAIATAIGHFRNRLLAEHLGVTPSRIDETLARHGSLLGTIAALAGGPRTLRAFEQLPEWPAAVLELARFADPPGPNAASATLEMAAPPLPRHGAPPDLRAIAMRLVLVAAALGGLAALWRYTPLARYLEPAAAVAWGRHLAGHAWAPWLLVAAYTPACFLLFPRPLITLGAVIAFGPRLGTLYALLGILIAAFVTYLAGRALPAHTVRHLTGHGLTRIGDTLRRRGLLAVTALRLVPLAPFAVLGLVAGAVRIKLWHFLLGSLLGLLPGTVVTALFGQELGHLVAEGGEFSYAPVVGVLLVFVVLVLLVRRWLLQDGKDHVPGH